MLNLEPFNINERCHFCGKELRNKIKDCCGYTLVNGDPQWSCFDCHLDRDFNPSYSPELDPGFKTFKPEVQFWTMWEWREIEKYQAARARGESMPMPGPVDFHAPIPSCWHCHTTKPQTGSRGWMKCDVCGVMLFLGELIGGGQC